MQNQLHYFKATEDLDPKSIVCLQLTCCLEGLWGTQNQEMTKVVVKWKTSNIVGNDLMDFHSHCLQTNWLTGDLCDTLIRAQYSISIWFLVASPSHWSLMNQCKCITLHQCTYKAMQYDQGLYITMQIFIAQDTLMKKVVNRWSQSLTGTTGRYFPCMINFNRQMVRTRDPRAAHPRNETNMIYVVSITDV